MAKIILFGGSGGLGKTITKLLEKKHTCISLGSKDCDVTSEDEVNKTLSIFNDFETIIYLSVKNIDGQIHNQTEETCQEQIDVNIHGFLNVLRHCTPTFRENGIGRIIYISSILSTKQIRGTGIYSATKSFCESVVKTYSLENSKYGITANTIQLGYFEGGLTDKVPDNVLNEVINKIPLKRLGTVNEIVSVIETIINNEYLNGTTISITGGL